MPDADQSGAGAPGEPDVEAPRYATDEKTGAAIRLSAEWSRVPAPPGVLAVAVTRWQDVTVVDCRPNVTLLSEPAGPDVEDVTAFGTQAIALAKAQFDDVHILSYDVWLTPPDRPPIPPGRRLTFAYRNGDVGIFVSQWLFHHDGVLTTLTGTCGVDLVTTIDQYFTFFATTVRLPRPQALR